ncbi:glycoside hydrolase family 13 protein [Schleiferilactobacillus shenzhenensis]|uniref:MalL n=1 Tax=Schleiferilactobacillus shenzhenensis LY-73 TaxID=1231336 RepID=U4TTY3_9LACO|nr:alpha-glucosidase [Schleiferilactobacillus shenzhenensis]ERL64897.1 MalL [Schleiferilactobacillus shenzhenensis LY-73]
MDKHWWQEAVVYQVYPRSFQDSNGDGIGDLDGIRQRLDYIKQLGMDVIWLNPIYRSPNDDNGYDISNYEAIQPDFGTMADFDALLKEAHAKGLKIVMDLVVNHTSDEHHWFMESRRSKDNPYRDYYIWQDPVDGHAPNDWQSSFSGSAWQFDETTGQYFLHLFSKKQPDLNWRNSKVRHSVYDMMTWWLDKGIDGFRMDVISLISKPKDFVTTPVRRPANGPHVHEYLEEMNKDVLSKFDIMTVGETPGVHPQDALLYAGLDSHELNMIFQFEHMGVDTDPELGKWRPHQFKLTTLKTIMSKWQTELNGRAWNSLYWNNHDQPRVVSRFGNDSDEFRERSAKMLGAVLHFQQGTPYIYQGEEIGMTNAMNFNSIEDYQDIESLNAYRDLVEQHQTLTNDQMIKALHHSSRDNARTPMQWDDSVNAGFAKEGVDPWLQLNANYTSVNVKNALADKESVFYFYQKMNTLRKQYPIITYGDYTLLDPDDEQTWTYTRKLDGQTLTLTANFSQDSLTRDYAAAPANSTLLLSNYDDDQGQTLRPYEVKVYLTK